MNGLNRNIPFSYREMAFITRPGFSTNTEVEASSFSVWNCVITFLQILLVSTMLYGAGWNQGQMYNITPENLINYHHFRAIAFFFCVWALQSVALAFLLVWAVGKRSYHLCHSWVLCETLMQVFIILSAVYFTYRSFLEDNFNQRLHSYYTHDRSSSTPPTATTAATAATSTSKGSHPDTFRPPRHFAFLIILHFLIKGFGFWIVWRYMKLLKTTNVNVISNNSEAGTNGNNNNCNGTAAAYSPGARQESPPPPYACLCKDELPCYDEALKLCLKDDSFTNVKSGGNVNVNVNNLTQQDSCSQVEPRNNEFVPA